MSKYFDPSVSSLSARLSVANQGMNTLSNKSPKVAVAHGAFAPEARAMVSKLSRFVKHDLGSLIHATRSLR
jgi:hypothetical protein